MIFFKAFTITGATTFFVTILAFANNIIITRYLGTEGRGKYSVIISLILLLSLIFGEGLRRSNIILAANLKNNLKIVFKKNLLFLFILLILGYLSYFLFSGFLSKFLSIDLLFIKIAVITAFLMILWQSLQSIFLGIENYIKFNTINILYTVCILVFNIIIIWIFNFGLFALLINFIIASSVVIIYETIGFKKLYFTNTTRNNKNSFFEQNYSLIIKATIASISGFLLLKGDIFIVKHFLGSSNAGIYSITLVITDLFQKLPLFIAPIVIARAANKNVSIEAQNIIKLSRVLIIVNLIASIFIFFVGKWIIHLLFSQSFDLSYYLLLYILPSLVIFSSGHIVNAFYMGQGYPKVVIINNFVFALLNLSLNYILLPIYGIKIVAVVCSLTYSGWAFSYLIYFSKQFNFSLSEMFILKYSDIIYIKKNFLKLF